MSQECIAKLHSEAFRGQETDLCDCVNMSKPASDLMCDMDVRSRGGSTSSELFAVIHLHHLLTRLKSR